MLSFVCLQTSDCRSAGVMLASAALCDHTGTFLIPKCIKKYSFLSSPHKPQHFVVFFQNGLIKSSYFCCFLLSSIFFLYFKISKKGTWYVSRKLVYAFTSLISASFCAFWSKYSSKGLTCSAMLQKFLLEPCSGAHPGVCLLDGPAQGWGELHKLSSGPQPGFSLSFLWEFGNAVTKKTILP